MICECSVLGAERLSCFLETEPVAAPSVPAPSEPSPPAPEPAAAAPAPAAVAVVEEPVAPVDESAVMKAFQECLAEEPR